MSNERTRKHKQSDRARRKFVIIAKIDQYVFVKYRCNDLEKFFREFLLQKYPGVLFANVFSNKGPDKRKLLYTWGKNKGLQQAFN